MEAQHIFAVPCEGEEIKRKSNIVKYKRQKVH